jgi:hypothetical protein
LSLCICVAFSGIQKLFKFVRHAPKSEDCVGHPRRTVARQRLHL